MRAFDGEQFAGNRTDVFFVGAVDAIAPLAGLLIQILPTGERAASQEVSVNKMEGTFDACRAVGIATFVSGEAKAETVAKRLHLGNRNHLGSRSAQHNDMRVVDHHARRGSAEVPQGVGQKDLAVEALERGVTLKEHHPRVTQHGRGGLDAALLASDFGLVGRGVVLKFLTRLEVIVAGGDFGFLPDAMTPAEGGQCRIGHLGSTAHQFFMDSNQIAFVTG